MRAFARGYQKVQEAVVVVVEELRRDNARAVLRAGLEAKTPMAVAERPDSTARLTAKEQVREPVFVHVAHRDARIRPLLRKADGGRHVLEGTGSQVLEQSRSRTVGHHQ